MEKVTAKGTAEATSFASAVADVRYSFTAQFMCASAIFARRSAEIEVTHPDNPDESTRTEHRGLVTAAIMQSAAAVEAESDELTRHGLGNHLGSDRMDKETRDFLAPLSEFIDRQPSLRRYELILHLLRKPPMSKGEQPWQDMQTLIDLRNELVHYKSRWGKEMERQSLYKTLQSLRLLKPSFIRSNSNFFPHLFMGAACAAWSVRTAVAFLNAFYERLGIESRLKPFMPQFEGL